jgi:hypothetical protein
MLLTFLTRPVIETENGPGQRPGIDTVRQTVSGDRVYSGTLDRGFTGRLFDADLLLRLDGSRAGEETVGL